MATALPPPAWLRTFEAAARHMSFTRAGEELHVTQSAVSQQVRCLEDRLGQALFHRSPQSLQLTEAGKAYVPVVHDAFDRLALGTRELFGTDRRDLVTIRSTPGFDEYWLAPRLPGLFASHPEIQLRISSTIWNTRYIEAGVDLEVRYGNQPWPELEKAPLTREHLVPVCSPGLADSLGGDPRNLANTRLLHTDGFRNGWPEWLRRARVADTVPAEGCHFDTAILPLRLAAQGVGVALGRRSLIEGELARGHLVRPFATVLYTEDAFQLAWPAACTLSEPARTVRDWLLSLANE